MSITRKSWTGPEIETLKQMAHNGYHAQLIAETLGRTKNSVHSKAFEHGVRIAYPSGDNFNGTTVSDRYVQAIKLLWDMGFSAIEVSEIFRRKHRVSTGYVKRICYGDKR